MLWLSSVSAVRHLSVMSVSELCEGPTVSAALAVLSSVFVIRGAVSKPGRDAVGEIIFSGTSVKSAHSWDGRSTSISQVTERWVSSSV